jgi:hypothetical protein
MADSENKISDAAIDRAAAGFADIIKPANRSHFVEDFTMGAKWMRRQMKELYENNEPTFEEGPLHRAEAETPPPPEPQTTGGTQSRP